MAFKFLLLAALVAASVASSHAGGFVIGGDSMAETFTHYNALPMNTSAAEGYGWTRDGSSCDPHLGILYGRGGGGAASETAPLQLYFTVRDLFLCARRTKRVARLPA